LRTIFDVFHTSRPSSSYLAALQRSQSELPLTYSGIGQTLGPLPQGWHHLNATRNVKVPAGVDGFAQGREAIRNWAAQRELQLILEPTSPPMVEGSVLVFALPMKPSGLWATGACRIVKVVDEPDRFGFVYGTLPHHPECGEEAFLVSRKPGNLDTVTFSVTAFSRGSKLPMRVSGPLGRLIQRRAAETYIDGYEKYVLATRAAI
jgi:uncharacterized protein (UPF0548 family)